MPAHTISRSRRLRRCLRHVVQRIAPAVAQVWPPSTTPPPRCAADRNNPATSRIGNRPPPHPSAISRCSNQPRAAFARMRHGQMTLHGAWEREDIHNDNASYVSSSGRSSAHPHAVPHSPIHNTTQLDHIGPHPSDAVPRTSPSSSSFMTGMQTPQSATGSSALRSAARMTPRTCAAALESVEELVREHRTAV